MFHLLLAVIYLSFISLGLPDSLLGSAWPSIYPKFQVPVSYAGIISMVIALGTIISSLQSDRLTKKLGTGKVTAISVAMTALALFGFSTSRSFLMLLFWAIPYGLGAGSVDASLNNYVALHYASRHMSWLHCMWGVGASLGPYIMGYALSGGQGWNMGYRYVALLQIALTVILIFSLPLWKKPSEAGSSISKADSSGKGTDTSADTLTDISADRSASKVSTEEKPLSLKEIFQIPGAKEIMAAFFCYCALEQTAGLWASSYFVLHLNLDAKTAASFASLFFIGITAGRAISGFLTIKLNDTQMIRLGQSFVLSGILLLFLPLGKTTAIGGLILIGLGCAPIYPCIIHSTPEHFGADKSQAIIGVQMACAYTGLCIMPPIFGLIANHISVALFPVYLFIILAVMVFMHEKLVRRELS